MDSLMQFKDQTQMWETLHFIIWKPAVLNKLLHTVNFAQWRSILGEKMLWPTHNFWVEKDFKDCRMLSAGKKEGTTQWKDTNEKWRIEQTAKGNSPALQEIWRLVEK